MRTLGLHRITVIAGVVLLLAAPTWAQRIDEFDALPTPDIGAVIPGGDGVGEGESFGLATQWTVYHASRWQPWNGTATPAYHSATGYIYPSGSVSGSYWTQIDLPAGALIDAICWLFNDDTASGQWHLDFAGYEAAYNGTSPYWIDFDSYASGMAETPGYAVQCRYLDPDVLIRQHDDLNNDGHNHYQSYVLYAYTTGSPVTSLELFGAVARWTRVISPAPTGATFDDVPVGAFGFQHVEALVDSGITAGCGGGNFCPDAPLTRVQMAVFLAKALGLHYPL
jgi:hypothetical protein